MPHRVIGTLTYTKDYAKYFGSQIAVSYYGGPTMRGSVDYVKNVYGDGAYNYSLIDIPTLANLQDASGNWGAGDWTFKDFKDGETVTYSGADQAKDLWNYIQKDKYLRTHTGKIAERNSTY